MTNLASIEGGGVLAITNGTLQGKWNIKTGGTMVIGDPSAGGSVNVENGILVNQGTVRWLNNNLLLGGYQYSGITNQGLFEIQADASLSQWYGAVPRFVNLGTVQKSGGTGVTSLSQIYFTNLALIETLSGTLRMPTGFTNSSGTLRLSGGKMDAQDVLNITGGTLEGSGSVGLVYFTGGVLSPGINGPGQITFENGLALSPNVTVAMGIDGLNQYDQILVKGSVALNNAQLQLLQVPVVAPGTTFVLIGNDGTDMISGTFSEYAEGSLFTQNDQLFRMRYASGSGNDVTLIRDAGGASLAAIPSRTNLVSFEFRGLGTNYASYGIYASTNLDDWVFLGNVSADAGGAFKFIDYDRTNYPKRFYRSLGP